MKVVRGESLSDKISRELSRSEEVYGVIVRIELTLLEFDEFISYNAIGHRVIPNGRVESGAYVTFKGVCFQTHKDYE